MTDDSDLVKYLRRIAGEMERHLGPQELAPGPDPGDLIDAAAAIERLTRENAAADSTFVHWRARAEAAEAELAKAREETVAQQGMAIAVGMKLDRAREALETIRSTFQRDEDQGYRSRDRQFAIEIARAALAPTDKSP